MDVLEFVDLILGPVRHTDDHILQAKRRVVEMSDGRLSVTDSYYLERDTGNPPTVSMTPGARIETMRLLMSLPVGTYRVRGEEAGVVVVVGEGRVEISAQDPSGFGGSGVN